MDDLVLSCCLSNYERKEKSRFRLREVEWNQHSHKCFSLRSDHNERFYFEGVICEKFAVKKANNLSSNVWFCLSSFETRFNLFIPHEILCLWGVTSEQKKLTMNDFNNLCVIFFKSSILYGASVPLQRYYLYFYLCCMISFIFQKANRMEVLPRCFIYSRIMDCKFLTSSWSTNLY